MCIVLCCVFFPLFNFKMEILKHTSLPYLSNYSLRIRTCTSNNTYVIEDFYTYWQVALQGGWSNLHHHNMCKRISVHLIPFKLIKVSVVSLSSDSFSSSNSMCQNMLTLRSSCGVSVVKKRERWTLLVIHQEP